MLAPDRVRSAHGIEITRRSPPCVPGLAAILDEADAALMRAGAFLLEHLAD